MNLLIWILAFLPHLAMNVFLGGVGGGVLYFVYRAFYEKK